MAFGWWTCDWRPLANKMPMNSTRETHKLKAKWRLLRLKQSVFDKLRPHSLSLSLVNSGWILMLLKTGSSSFMREMIIRHHQEATRRIWICVIAQRTVRKLRCSGHVLLNNDQNKNRLHLGNKPQKDILIFKRGGSLTWGRHTSCSEALCLVTYCLMLLFYYSSFKKLKYTVTVKSIY